MIARFMAAANALLSDRSVQDGQVELRIALAQAVLIGAPIVAIGIVAMAVMP